MPTDISDLQDEEALEDFRCSITRALMRDPVVCADGHSYERVEIERWLRTRHRLPPVSFILSTHTCYNINITAWLHGHALDKQWLPFLRDLCALPL